MTKTIGLLSLDDKKIYNTALMQISQYHKNLGDQVEWYSRLKDTFDPNFYNKVYVSSLFSFSPRPKFIYHSDKFELGGTGFDVQKRLPEIIEQTPYDYSIYPKMDYSLVWFSRGCIRNCPFCLVREKEGYIYSVEPFPLNPDGEHIKVMDNNFFANPQWRKAIEQLQEWNQKVDFQGVDVRLLDEEQSEALNSLKHYRQIHIAWDMPDLDLREKLDQIITLIKPYKLMCYVLVNYNSTIKQDMYRINELAKRKITPYVMIYKDFNKHNQIIEPIYKHLARWCNRSAIRKSCTFQEYLDSSNITFSQLEIKQEVAIR